MKYLLVFLFSFLIAAGCSQEEKRYPVTDSQIYVFNYLPSETQFITYMNLNELRATEFWDNFFKPSIESNKENDWLTEFESETGVGLNNGVKEVFISSTWEGNNVIAVVFDEITEMIKNFFHKDENFLTEEINGIEIHKKTESPQSYFLFVQNSVLLIISDSNYLKQLAEGTQSSLNSNIDLISVIEKIENKEQYWMASDKYTYALGLLGELNNYKSNKEIKSMLSSLKGISISAEFSSGVELKSVWTCEDSKSAYILTSAIKGSVALDLLSKENPAVNRILNKMKIERKAGNVNISVSLNLQDLKDLKVLSKEDGTLKKL